MTLDRVSHTFISPLPKSDQDKWYSPAGKKNDSISCQSVLLAMLSINTVLALLPLSNNSLSFLSHETNHAAMLWAILNDFHYNVKLN